MIIKEANYFVLLICCLDITSTFYLWKWKDICKRKA